MSSSNLYSSRTSLLTPSTSNNSSNLYNSRTSLLSASSNSIPPKYTLSFEQWVFLCSFFVSTLMQESIAYLPGPLFPQEAEKKGLSFSVYGAIMGTSGFTMIFATFLGLYIDRIGVGQVYVVSTFINGLCPTIFGLLDYINSPQIFTASAFLTRGLEGISIVGSQYSMYAICFTMFPGRFGTAVSIVETGFLTGALLGPFLGAIIFTHIGYTWTFISFGIIQICIALLSFVYLPPVPEYELIDMPVKDVLKGYKEILLIPNIMLFFVASLFVEGGTSFVSTILEPGLREHHLSNMGVGLTFFCLGAFNILTPLWGLVLDNVSRAELIVATSFIVICISLMILGPLPFLPIQRTYTTTIYALLLFGFGHGMLNVSTAINFQLEVEDKSVSETESVSKTFIPIVFVASSGLGSLIGSTSAGILFEHVGFAHSLLWIFCANLTVGCSIFCYMASRKCRPRGSIEGEVDEKLPILKIN